MSEDLSDPFTQANLAIWNALASYPGFSSLVRVGNRLGTTSQNVPLNKSRGTYADTADAGQVRIQEAGFTLSPFGSNSRISESRQSYGVQFTTQALTTTPLNRLKWNALKALKRAGDDLGLPFVRGWSITEASEGLVSAIAPEEPRTQDGWATAFTVNVEMYWPRTAL